MADESPIVLDRSIFSDYDRTPTSTNQTSHINDRDTHRNDTQAARTHAEETGLSLGACSWQPTNKASDREVSWLAHGRDDHHASTPPIDVPRPKTAGEEHWMNDKADMTNGMHGAGYVNGHRNGSPLEDFMRNRRTSVSFSPEVILDCGQHQSIGEPLPKIATKTRPINKAALKELERYPARFELSRTHSEADIRDYDPVTGELLDRHPSHFDLNNRHAVHSPFRLNGHFSADTSELTQASYQKEQIIEQAVSLTSDSTASESIKDSQTPPDTMAMEFLSPVSTFPPFAYPTSLEDSSAWPIPRRQASASRAKSYYIERTMSMRQGRRSGSRRSPSSSMSPATAFLARFAKEEAPPEPDSEGREIGEYVVGKQVGFGGFSTVKEAFTIEGDERICRAVKVVRKQLAGKEEAENDRLQAEFEREVHLWRCLGHRNILPLIEVYDTDFATFCFTKLNTGGTLFDKVRSNRQGLGRDLTRRYAYQLASAIRYLHEDVRIVHRDIKLENCLIDTSDPDTAQDGGNLLLCDFGLAEFIVNDLRQGSPNPDGEQQDHHPSYNRRPSLDRKPSSAAVSIAGSLQYASPELIMSPAGFLSPVVDVWAFGVVIYALLVGDLPFQHVFQPRVQMMILAGEWNAEVLERAKGIAGYEDETLEFMHGCLDMDSESRWTVGRVLSCRWLKGMQEMLEEIGGSFKL